MREQIIQRRFFSFFSCDMSEPKGRSLQELDNYLYDFMKSLPNKEWAGIREVHLNVLEFGFFRNAVLSAYPIFAPVPEDAIVYQNIRFIPNNNLTYQQHILKFVN